ncbi:hypothetical protein RBB78_24805 (plasmid) [Tunturiibacter empetritectus]|uniref:hypothetical protein n=1 Tax=Tunturiibacter empetritectus TaxID=3069691 RepID=UPI003D9B4C42
MNQQQAVTDIIAAITGNNNVLTYAQNIGNAIVDGPANHCAATLSALLTFAGIYPNAIDTSSGNLEPWVPYLVNDLETNLNWTKLAPSSGFNKGDVGVVMMDTVHHVYLVVDATDQAMPTVADNRNPAPHQRAVAGDATLGWSPTSFFLRAPTS